MKNAKKTIILIFAVIILTLISMLFQVSATAADFSYMTVGDEITITRYNGTSADITVPAAIDGKPVTIIGKNAFKQNRTVKNVVLPENIKVIDSYAFAECTSLLSITLPNTLVTIKGEAFGYCYSLQEIVIPESIDFIGNRAFYNCTALTKITLPDKAFALSAFVFDNTAYFINPQNWEEHVLYIGTHLVTTDRNINGSYTVKEGTRFVDNYALRYNRFMTEVVFPESVEHIGGYNFDGCERLNEVKFPQNITTVNWGMFTGSGIKSIKLPETVTDITYKIFNGCSSLSDITLPKGIKSIGESTFFGCINLTEVVIPEGVTTIDEFAFTYCEWLETIILPSTLTTLHENAFSGCLALKNVYFCGSEEQWNKIEIVPSQSANSTPSPITTVTKTFDHKLPEETTALEETATLETKPLESETDNNISKTPEEKSTSYLWIIIVAAVLFVGIIAITATKKKK